MPGPALNPGSLAAMHVRLLTAAICCLSQRQLRRDNYTSPSHKEHAIFISTLLSPPVNAPLSLPSICNSGREEKSRFPIRGPLGSLAAHSGCGSGKVPLRGTCTSLEMAMKVHWRSHFCSVRAGAPFSPPPVSGQRMSSKGNSHNPSLTSTYQ